MLECSIHSSPWCARVVRSRLNATFSVLWLRWKAGAARLRGGRWVGVLAPRVTLLATLASLMILVIIIQGRIVCSHLKLSRLVAVSICLFALLPSHTLVVIVFGIGCIAPASLRLCMRKAAVLPHRCPIVVLSIQPICQRSASPHVTPSISKIQSQGRETLAT